jgi:homoprotocatechuate degradation regulator HpaR
MQVRDFDHSLPMLLLRAREATMGHFRPMLAVFGVTEQQWRVLRALWDANGCEIRMLSDRTLISRPSMTGIIDRLERDGLVERRSDPEDGRRTTVHLTRKARRLYERIAPEAERHYANMQARFTGSRWQDLHDALQHLIRVNGDSADGLSGGEIGGVTGK